MSKGDLKVPTVVIGGTVWSTIVTSAKSVKGLRGKEGLCDSTKHTMYINGDVVPPQRFNSVRFHEEMHASGDLAEARYVMQRLLDVSEQEMFEIEEHFIRIYGSAMFAQLTANGHLRYPDFQAVEDTVGDKEGT